MHFLAPVAVLTLAAIGSSNAVTLDAGFKAKGKKYFGTIADANLLNNPSNVAIIKSDFGALTPENSLSTFIYHAGNRTSPYTFIFF